MNSMASTTDAAMATTAVSAQQDAGAEADADEMPMLFMDGLPSGFQQSAQLAALATFMADSDDGGGENDGGDSEQQAAWKRQPTTHLKHAKRQSRMPYARPEPATNKGDAANGDRRSKGKKKKESGATKELQLYLSMFKV